MKLPGSFFRRHRGGSRQRLSLASGVKSRRRARRFAPVQQQQMKKKILTRRRRRRTTGWPRLRLRCPSDLGQREHWWWAATPRSSAPPPSSSPRRRPEVAILVTQTPLRSRSPLSRLPGPRGRSSNCCWRTERTSTGHSGAWGIQPLPLPVRQESLSLLPCYGGRKAIARYPSPRTARSRPRTRATKEGSRGGCQSQRGSPTLPLIALLSPPTRLLGSPACTHRRLRR